MAELISTRCRVAEEDGPEPVGLERFGRRALGACYTGTGRPFFKDDLSLPVLERASADLVRVVASLETVKRRGRQRGDRPSEQVRRAERVAGALQEQHGDADGAEVAILAWRPAPGDATLYCVRVKESGVEGWLPVRSLRSTEIAAAPPASYCVAIATGS